MVTDHERTFRRLFQGVWNGEDPDLADELVHDEYVVHDRDLAESLGGPARYRALADATREIFPDASFALEDVVAAGDRVAVRWTMTGTHEGSAYGVEPTGRRVTMAAIEIDRFADGQLVESWIRSDQFGLLVQLGALPSDVRP